MIRRQFGTGLVRALLVSRTETLRAYREAAHRNYEANADVVEGWIWHATLTTRTCAACWAMHGSFHRLDERLDDHPNGRCAPVPAVKPWKALGYDIPDNRPVIESGEAAFARLTAQEQERVLGKAAYAAFADGAVSLADFAGRRHSDDWGTTLARRSLREMVGDEAARRWIESARVLSRQNVLRQRQLQWQNTRMSELAGQSWEALWGRLRINVALPQEGQHFRKHGLEFQSLGIESVQAYVELFSQHVDREDLRLFSYIRPENEERMWLLIGMDNGVIAQYNETRGVYWSFYRHADVYRYLESGAGWWIEMEAQGARHWRR